MACKTKKSRKTHFSKMMKSDAIVYLRGNVLAEPLFNGWYVTLPWIAPHTSAMLVKNLHLKILKSYIRSPDFHIAAAADPSMRGGPFSNIDKSLLPVVIRHLENTLISQKSLIAFAKDIETLDDLLQSEATGHSLEPLYAKVPESLKGYVELVYDLNNVPSIRFLEGLLYHSEYFDTRQQSILLSESTSDTRPFVLSTPRFLDNTKVEIRKPFSSVVYDELFRMRKEPRAFGEICEALQITSEQLPIFQTFFEAQNPAQRAIRSCQEGGIEVKYFGHACLLIESRNVSILFDPLISYEKQSGADRFTYTDLPDVIDYIVITHSHLDHIVLETMLQLRYKVRNIIVPKTSRGLLAEPSLKLMLKNLGFRCDIIELDELEQVCVPGGTITGIPFLGEHHDLHIRGKSAYRLCLGGRSFLVAADSVNLEPKVYEHIRSIFGAIDTIFLGMECDGAPLTWFYGHLLTRPMDREMAYSRQGSGSDQQQASKIVESLGCKQVFIYAMGLEPWFGHILSLSYTPQSKQIIESDRFLEVSKERGVAAERLYAKKILHF